MNDLFRRLDIAASGLTAHRQWMDLIAGNIANAETTRTPEGGPFRRQLAVFMEMLDETRPAQRGEGGAADPATTRSCAASISPQHPDADAQGYVSYPNVDVVMEMVDLIAASRAYEANATVIEAAKSSAQRTIGMLQA